MNNDVCGSDVVFVGFNVAHRQNNSVHPLPLSLSLSLSLTHTQHCCTTHLPPCPTLHSCQRDVVAHTPFAAFSRFGRCEFANTIRGVETRLCCHQQHSFPFQHLINLGEIFLFCVLFVLWLIVLDSCCFSNECLVKADVFDLERCAGCCCLLL